MAETEKRTCPECGERLAFDARQCACGWGGEGKRRKGLAKPTTPNMGWQHACTWRSGQLFCTYPVGAFYENATRGFCIFHRAKPDGIEAAEIARDSAGCSPEEYVERAKRLVHGEPGTANQNVTRLRAQLKRHADGDRVGLFATRVLGPQAEPGELG